MGTLGWGLCFSFCLLPPILHTDLVLLRVRPTPGGQTDWRPFPTQTQLRFHRFPWDVALRIWKLERNLLVSHPFPLDSPEGIWGPGTRSGHGLSSLRAASTRIWRKLSIRGLERRSVSRRHPGSRSQLWTGQNVTFPSSHTSLWLLLRGNPVAPGPFLLPLDHEAFACWAPCLSPL